VSAAPTAPPRRPNGVVVVAHPRSGTNFLRETLNQHPCVYLAGEAFHTDPVIRRLMFQLADAFQAVEPGFPGLGGHEPAEDRQMGLDTVEWLLDRCRRATARETIGLTVFSQAMGHGLSREEVERLLLRGDIQPVFLIRRNLLKAFVSLKRAEATGVWHMDQTGALIEYPDRTVPSNAVMRWIDPIDVAEARDWIQENRRFLDQVQKALAAAGKPSLTVYYEDLCLGGPARTRLEIDRVLAFLGLDPMPRFDIKMGQTAAREFYDAIPNRQDLIDGTGFDLDQPPCSPNGWAARIRTLVGQLKGGAQTLAIAPAGQFARSLLELPEIREVRLLGFFDRAPSVPGTSWAGLPVWPYEELRRTRPDVVLVASPLREDEIVRELLGHGQPRPRIIRLSEIPAAP